MRELLEATGLGPFADRPAGKLSGGMKQKVGLCGALVHDPDLLILDEPTTGVDPLSRRQFWTLIDDIRASRPGMSVVISTAYMDEAQQWDWIVAMDAGRVLATGSPAELIERTGTKDLEHCFIALLPEEKRKGHTELTIPPRPAGRSEIAIEAHGLTMRFGAFTAVDHVSLSIERGEIFGFLGSNGCGKSTTMKMLTGLLPPTEGTATLFGSSVEAGSMEVRKNLGYMTQAFSLYGELTIRQNLVLHARLYHLPPEKAKTRIDELVTRFGLDSHVDALAGVAADGAAPAALAGGRRPARAADPDPRRADLRRRSGRARQLLGAAHRSVAPAGGHHLRHHPLHERGDALRSDLAHARAAGCWPATSRRS